MVERFAKAATAVIKRSPTLKLTCLQASMGRPLGNICDLWMSCEHDGSSGLKGKSLDRDPH